MFARLGLELLDTRNAPSSVVGNAVASADWLTDRDSFDWMPAYVGKYDAEPVTAPPANTKPVINNFRVQPLDGGIARYSGTVSDESPSGLSVLITGVQACLGNGQTVVTDAEGYFQWEGSVRTTVDAGPAYANVSDAQGLAADRVEYSLDI
jgi:hypothetical protein